MQSVEKVKNLFYSVNKNKLRRINCKNKEKCNDE